MINKSNLVGPAADKKGLASGERVDDGWLALYGLTTWSLGEGIFVDANQSGSRLAGGVDGSR